MRKLSELLELMLLPENREYFFRGLCDMAFFMYWAGRVITAEERKQIARFLRQEMEKLDISPLEFLFQEHEWEPREEWLKAKIAELKAQDL